MSQIEIKTWNKKYQTIFSELSKDWINRYFSLEECDLKILEDPQETIIDQGGEIFFAVEDGIVLGCCALIIHSETTDAELGKMCVHPSAQGKGIGYKLGESLLECARQKGIQKVYLEANTILKPSINLYHKLGFKEVLSKQPSYKRCNLYMEIEI